MSNEYVTRKRRHTQTLDEHSVMEQTWTEKVETGDYETERRCKVNPKILEHYRKNAPELLSERLERPNEVNEAAFWSKVAKCKNEVKREITQVHRLFDNGKEKFFYSEHLISTDDLGNSFDHTHTVGFYELPQFQYQLGIDGQKIASEIKELKTIYELNWPTDWTVELEKRLIEKSGFCIKTDISQGSITYGGFTYPDFKEHSFSDLITIGKYGTLNTIGIEREKDRQRHSKLK